MYVSTSEGGELVSSSITISNEENRIKTQDDESAQKQAPPNLSRKSKSKYRLVHGECIQLHWNCTLESLEIQAHSNPEDKHSAHNPEVRETSFSQIGNRVNSPDKQHYIRKDVYNQGMKLVDIKGMGSLSPAAMKDNFCINNNYHHGEVNGTVIAKEGMNEFPKEGGKEQKSFSEHIVENIQGYSEHSAEDEAVKQKNEKDVNMLNEEGIPPGATPLGVFQNEKDTSEHGSHMQIYNSVTDTVPKNEIQGSEVQIDGKVSEEINELKTTEHFVKTQVSDSSLTAKVIYGHSLHTFSKEGIHSSQISPSLTYKKTDKLKGEQKVSTSHHKISDTETFSSPKFEDSYRKNFLSLGPKEKSINQMVLDSKNHLIVDTVDSEVENLRISTQINDIENSEVSQSKFHQRSMHAMPNLLGVTSQKKVENSVKITDNDNLLQEQLNVPQSIFSENTVLHLEVQSDTDININPSKLSSHDNPHHFKTVNRHMEQILPYSKDGLDIYHSVVDTNDEPFACDRFPFLPNNLNHAEEIACSQHTRGSKEKGSKDMESEKETEHKDIHDGNNKRAEEGIVSNQESTNNKDSRNITNQIRAERQEVDIIIISDFEQDKHEVQITEITTDFDNFTIKEHRSEVQVHSTEEKSATADSKKNSQKDLILAVQKAEPVSPETVQNYKLIIDTELDMQVTTYFRELYSKLTEESKRGSQAHLCERHQFQQIEQELEKLRHGIITFPHEDIYRETRQIITSVEYEPKLNTGHEKCWKNKMDLFLELQSLVLDIRNKCEDRNAESDEKPNNAQYVDEKPNNGQHVEAKHMPTENMEKKIHTSLKNGQHQQDLEGKLPGNNLLIQDYVLSNEGWLFQIILHLNDFCAFIASGFSVLTSISEKVVAALPEDIRPGPDLYGCPWEIVIFIILLVMYRSYQSIRSRLYVGKEKQLASKVAELIEDKRILLEKFSFCKKEYEELDNTLKDASLLQGSAISSDLQTECKELNSSNSVLENEIEHLEKELKEEQSKRAEQDDMVSEIQRRIESLENEDKSTQSQIAEAKTTLKVYEINRERLKTAIENTVEENRHLYESEKQLLHEVEGWEKGCSELSEQINMFECSKADMEETLRNKESEAKSTTECLLKMKDWSSAIGENDVAEDSHWEKDTKSETENREHLDEQEKQTVRKLINAVKLNAHLKSVETERNQIYAKLTEENKAKEELKERIESQQKKHVVSQSEIRDLENEVEKLQQKLKVMTELYQENEMNLHRKLTVEEKERLQKEEKLSKMDEKIVHAAEELNTYRQRAKDLEEELERTVHSYQNQLMYHEKKGHDNWLSSRAAERHLSDIRKENWHIRQKLTESEFRYDVLKKDPYALDVPVRTFGREHSPYGVSPMSRPSSETRAFLSPPTLLEGPLRFSPVLPGGGGRGSRGPGNTGTYDVGSERGEMNFDRLSDHHRPSSDTGSLSPPWDRDQRIISSQTDGQAYENNSKMDLSGNGIKDHPNDTNMVNRIDQSFVAERETFGPANGPPIPLLRAPLMPVDARGPFMRRGLPFPPMPPPPGYGPPPVYGPRDFSGPPRPLMPMRSQFPVRPFSQYPPPRAGFLPPAPLSSDNRNEQTAEPTHPSPAVPTSVT